VRNLRGERTTPKRESVCAEMIHLVQLPEKRQGKDSYVYFRKVKGYAKVHGKICVGGEDSGKFTKCGRA